MVKCFKIVFFLLFAATALTGQNDTTFSVAEKMPEFPGGTNAIARHIGTTMLYPPLDREANHKGKVYVRFVVDTAGKVKLPTIVKSSGYKNLDLEALRIVEVMPNWVAGEENGKKVSVFINIPISFGGTVEPTPAKK